MRTAPLLVLVLVLAGCLGQDPSASSPQGGGSFRAQLFGSGQVFLQVHAVADRQPTAASVEALQDAVAGLTGKPVERGSDLTIARLPDAYTVDQLRALLAPSAEAADRDGAAVLHLFAVNGNVTDAATESGGALGLHLGGGILVALMDDILGDAGTPVVSPRVPGVDAFQYKLERAVFIHEFGHAAGLVDCGIPMVEPRADPASRCHSVRRTSVMLAEIHDNLLDPAWVAQNGLGGLDYVWSFDEADLADGRAFQASLG